MLQRPLGFSGPLYKNHSYSGPCSIMDKIEYGGQVQFLPGPYLCFCVSSKGYKLHIFNVISEVHSFYSINIGNVNRVTLNKWHNMYSFMTAREITSASHFVAALVTH